MAAVLVGFMAEASAEVASKADAPQRVSSIGQAAVIGTDVANARDKAVDDALRKAVEQSVGTMITSETVTQNFQLLSDKVFSKARGYVRNYKITSEKQDQGVYIVGVDAEVSSGNLKNDVDGIMHVLRAKNMPRMLIMIAEQNIGQGDANFWWGNKTFSTNLDAAENTFMDHWMKKGVRFVDRQALQGKISAGPATTSAEPTNDAIKEFAGKSGAEVVIVGKAVATDVGTIMGTQMHSARANISLRALSLDTGRILATATRSEAVGHVDPTTGGTLALKKAAEKSADELLEKIMAQWSQEVSGPATITLNLTNVKQSKNLRSIAQVLREQVRGVQEVRQLSFKNKAAELEVELKGSAQDLADELETKTFPGFAVDVQEVTANSVTAALK
ncbi:MAG: flagellar assembly protein T N-terminal domain-containing protein [Myxococcota bacterium]